jgi:ATP/maltotriose-dependent transcriptional regulator MalT
LLDVLARAELALGDPEAARARHAEILRRLEPSDRHADAKARAHLALAELAPDQATRSHHARACIDLLEPTGFSPERLARARALLGGLP